MRKVTLDRALGIKVVLALLGTYALWGGNTVSIKLSLKGYTPLMVFVLRSVVSLVFLSVWSWARSTGFGARGRDRNLLLIYTALSAGAMIAFLTGVKFTTASRAAVFVNSYPLFAVFLAHYALAGHQLTWQKLLGSLLALAGLAVAFLGKYPAKGFLLGDGIMIISALFLAVRIVMAKKMVVTLDPAKLLIWSVALPVPPFLAASLLLEGPPALVVPGIAIFGVLYQGVILGFFCHLVQATLLKYYSANTLASFTFLLPIYGVFYSILFLGDPITTGIILGTILVALGIFTVNYTPRPGD